MDEIKNKIIEYARALKVSADAIEQLIQNLKDDLAAGITNAAKVELLTELQTQLEPIKTQLDTISKG